MTKRPENHSKITRPFLDRVLYRERLFRRLDEAREAQQLIWLHGPAGSGKTTLISSYVLDRKITYLWYQLDQGDTDPATFFHYLNLAARKAAPRKRRKLPAFNPEYRQGIREFSRDYFTHLWDRFQGPALLVVDNYQELLPDAALHQALIEGFERFPEQVNLVLVSRSKPHTGSIRLKANRRLTTIDGQDLRLTARECQEIIRLEDPHGSRGARLLPFLEKINGWAAGLRLFLDSAELGEDLEEGLVEAPLESVFDYFAGEILDGLDLESRHFLLKASFLPHMTVQSAQKLTGNMQAARLLSALHRNNQFTEKRHTPLRYQFHPLFRHFLQARAGEQLSKAMLTALRREAAFLLLSEGDSDNAAVLLEEAGDWQELVPIILQQAPALWRQGRLQTLEKWLRNLPSDYLAGQPWLLYWRGVCRQLTDPAEARKQLIGCYRLFKENGEAAGLYLAWAAVVETFIQEWHRMQPLDEWIEELSLLRNHFPVFPAAVIEARVIGNMFCALLYRQPHHPEIGEWVKRAEKIAETAADPSQRLMVGHHLFLYFCWQGNYAGAGSILHSLGTIIPASQIPVHLRLVYHVLQATLFWLTGNQEEADRKISEGLALAQHRGVHAIDHRLLEVGVHNSLAAGDYRQAADLLKRFSRQTNFSRLLPQAQYHSLSACHTLMANNDPSLAREQARLSLALARQAGAPLIEAFSHLIMFQILMVLREEKEALHHLKEAIHLGRSTGSLLIEYMYLLFRAQFCFMRDHESWGFSYLREALAMGRAKNYLCLPCWHPAAMMDICTRALQAGIEVEHVQQLIKTNRLLPPSPPVEVEHWPWLLRIYTLGRFGIVENALPLQFSARAQQKPLALLKMLIALGGRNVPEDRIADFLWPEADGDLQHQTLATTLHRLRRLLKHPEAIAYREGQLSLNNRLCWVDAWAVERLFNSLEDTWERKPALAATRASGVLTLYRGHFLAQEVKVAAYHPMRERLRSKFLNVTERLGNYFQRQTNWQEAIGIYQDGLVLEPLAEPLYQHLMHCHYQRGSRADAAGVYNQCRLMLRSGLGIEPSSMTTALYRKYCSEAN